MSAALHWTWELPQTLLGAALLAALRRKRRVHLTEALGGRVLVETDYLGLSLGRYVFWARYDLDGTPTDAGLIRAHEWGHTEQSRRLGWMYLLTVGVVSPSRALYGLAYQRRTGRIWPHYFDAWPEDAADRHGGIVRDPQGRRRLATPPLAELARRP